MDSQPREKVFEVVGRFQGQPSRLAAYANGTSIQLLLENGKGAKDVCLTQKPADMLRAYQNVLNDRTYVTHRFEQEQFLRGSVTAFAPQRQYFLAIIRHQVFGFYLGQREFESFVSILERLPV